MIARHNEVRDEIAHLATCAFSPNAVRDEPYINISHDRTTSSEREKGEETEQDGRAPPTEVDDRGDVLIRGFWERATDCIIDVKITGTIVFQQIPSQGPGNARAFQEN